MKLQFAEELFDLMERREINRSELAARIGSSDACVARALRGDSNVTIDTMIRFARALEGKLEIHVRAAEDNERCFADRGIA